MFITSSITLEAISIKPSLDLQGSDDRVHFTQELNSRDNGHSQLPDRHTSTSLAHVPILAMNENRPRNTGN
jgi:hypothetical protein